MALIYVLMYLFFKANDTLSWSLRSLLLSLIALIAYLLYRRGHRAEKMAPKLLDKEKEISKKLQEIYHDEKEIISQRDKLRDQIDRIIREGIELKEYERHIGEDKKDVAQKIEDKQLKDFLLIVDNLFAKLPEPEIDRFAKSEDYRLYKSFMEEHGMK